MSLPQLLKHLNLRGRRARVPKAIVGLTEEITLFGAKKPIKLMAKIDTGATQSSIGTSLATEMALGPIVSAKIVKSSHGTTLRAVIRAEISFAGKRIKAKFNIADRRHMRYKMLIGVNILKKCGVLVDPSRK